MRSGAPQEEGAAGAVTRAVKPRGRLQAWPAALARQTRQYPGRTVALTFGAGFILGGGLFSPLAARLVGAGVRLGLRLIVLPRLVEGLGLLASAAFAGTSVDASSLPFENKKRNPANETQ